MHCLFLNHGAEKRLAIGGSEGGREKDFIVRFHARGSASLCGWSEERFSFHFLGLRRNKTTREINISPKRTRLGTEDKNVPNLCLFLLLKNFAAT